MPKLLTLLEAADRLRLSPWTVRRLVRQGKLRTARIVAGKWLFSEEALADLVSASEGRPVVATSEEAVKMDAGTEHRG